MTLKLGRRFVIEISPTSLIVVIPYVGHICLGHQMTPLDRWKALRNTG